MSYNYFNRQERKKTYFACVIYGVHHFVSLFVQNYAVTYAIILMTAKIYLEWARSQEIRKVLNIYTLFKTTGGYRM